MKNAAEQIAEAARAVTVYAQAGAPDMVGLLSAWIETLNSIFGWVAGGIAVVVAALAFSGHKSMKDWQNNLELKLDDKIESAVQKELNAKMPKNMTK